MIDEIESADADAHTIDFLAVALARLGDHPGAAAVLLKARDRWPSDFWIQCHGALYSGCVTALAAQEVECGTAAVALRPQSAHSRTSLGFALLGAGDLDGAIAAAREAIRLNPDFPSAYLGLGYALADQGRLREALASFEKANELSTRLRGWSCGEFVASIRQAVELEGRLAAVLAGTDRPRDAAECAGFALLCYCTREYATSARLYREAFAQDGSLAEEFLNGHRYAAACNAALAAAGGGADAPMWRAQALEWLRAELAVRMRSVAKAASDPAPLYFWTQDRDLSSVRDRIDELPVAEREGWRRLWADVHAAMGIR